MNLSKRLSAVAAYFQKGDTMADIGSDHGYLPIYLAEENLTPSAIATDVRVGPLSSAEKNIAEAGLTHVIQTRLGNGLEVLQPGEVDCVTICGMGASLTEEILEARPEVTASLKRLILQPNIAAVRLRRWAQRRGWNIIAENLIFEEKHYYEIMVLEKGSMQLSLAQQEIGPCLLQDKHPLLKNYLIQRKEKDVLLMQSLQQSDLEEAKEKWNYLRRKWTEVEAAYQCQFNAALF